MVPPQYVFLQALPLLSSGKVDRQKLLPHALPARPASPAGDAVEREVRAIWTEVLGTARFSADDNFFDLGGHSLLAARVVARVNHRFGTNITVRQLFENPTLAGVAALARASSPNKSAMSKSATEA
jgi:aryl carrier-like protein